MRQIPMVLLVYGFGRLFMVAVLFLLSLVLSVNALWFDINQGQALTYDYTTYINSCGKTPIKDNFNKFECRTKISLLWRQKDLKSQSHHKLYKIELFDVNQFNESTLELSIPFYFNTYDNQISPIIFSNIEKNISINIKKGIASFFQLTGHNMTEQDIYNQCQSIYSPNKHFLIKRRMCQNLFFSIFSQDKGLIPFCQTQAFTRFRYKMTPDFIYFKDVTAISQVRASSYLSPDVVLFNCSITQSMKLYKVEKIPAAQIIKADSLNNAILALNPRYMEEMHGQTMKLDPEITILPPTPLDSIEEYERFLRQNTEQSPPFESEFAEVEMAMNLTHLFKKLDYNALYELFNFTLDKYPDKTAVFMDALLSTKTSVSEKFILSHLLDTKSHEILSMLDRINLALNTMGAHVNPAFVMTILEGVVQAKSTENNFSPLHTSLIPTLGGLLYKLCKSHYLCRHKEAQNGMKVYYNFITSSLTDAMHEGFNDEDGYQKLLPFITSLANLPSFYSATILKGLLKDLFRQNKKTPKHQHRDLDLVLTHLTEALSRFACQNFQDIPQYLLPKFYEEIGGHTQSQPHSNEILSVLNEIYLDTSFRYALARDNLAAILLRCDYSQLFLTELTDNLIERYKLGRDHEDYIYQYSRIKQMLSFRPTYREWKYVHNLMLKMFPHYMLAHSHASYTPINRHQIGQFVFLETTAYRNSMGDVENLKINLRLKDSQLFQVKFRAPHTHQSSDLPNPTTSIQTPPITAQFSVGQNLFLPTDLDSLLEKSDLKFLDTPYKSTLSIQDIVGAFCLPNGFPVNFIYTGAIQSEIEPSFQPNSLDNSYELLLNIKLKYLAQSSFAIVGDTYQSNLTQTSLMTSTLKIKGNLDGQGYKFKESQLCIESLTTNYTRNEDGISDKMETKSPVYTLPSKCEWLF